MEIRFAGKTIVMRGKELAWHFKRFHIAARAADSV